VTSHAIASHIRRPAKAKIARYSDTLTNQYQLISTLNYIPRFSGASEKCGRVISFAPDGTANGRFGGQNAARPVI